MVQALELPKATTPAGLALFAVGNALSRVVTGAISEGFVQSGIPRPALLLVAAFASTVAHALLAMADDEFEFLVSVALAGVAFGMYHPLLILIVGELFGPKYLASNFLFFDGFSLAAGSLVVNKFISQHVYEAHLQEGEKTCIGKGCFGVTHWITCGLCMSSLVTCSCLLATKLSRQAYTHAFLLDK
jgi:MFS family permease